MVDQVVLVPHPDDERRWQNSQARGEADRRTARRVFGVLLLIIVTFLVWAFVQVA
jgi:hypothetical protein